MILDAGNARGLVGAVTSVQVRGQVVKAEVDGVRMVWGRWMANLLLPGAVEWAWLPIEGALHPVLGWLSAGGAR